MSNCGRIVLSTIFITLVIVGCNGQATSSMTTSVPSIAPATLIPTSISTSIPTQTATPTQNGATPNDVLPLSTLPREDMKRIVFARPKDLSGSDIYVMYMDGSEVTRLTNTPTGKSAPAWSPDGKRIVFESLDDAGQEIHVMNVDGSGEVKLADAEGFAFPSWSPDSTRIAYWFSNKLLYMMNADGSTSMQLANRDESSIGPPAWSPDGTRIAYCGDRRLYVVNTDGSGLTTLLEEPLCVSVPTWSPDGKQIAFVSDLEGASEIYTIGADGSGLRQLTNDQNVWYSPAWSPDGKRIAFFSRQHGGRELYVLEVDNAAVTYVADATDDYIDELARQRPWPWPPFDVPYWSSDSEMIAFTALHKEGLVVYVVNVHNSRRVNPTSSSGILYWFSWEP